MLNHSLLDIQVIGAAYAAEQTTLQDERSIKKHVGPDGVTVYCLTVESLPPGESTCYLLLGKPVTLIAPSPDWEITHDGLVNSFAELRERFGERVALCDIKRVILTHGRIDLFPPAIVTPETLPTHVNDLLRRRQLVPTKPQLPTHPAIIYEPM